MLYKQHAYIWNTGKHAARQHVYIMFAYGCWVDRNKSVLRRDVLPFLYTFFFGGRGEEEGGGVGCVGSYVFVLPFEMC